LLLLLFIGTSCTGKKENKSPIIPPAVTSAPDTAVYAIITFDEKQTYLFRNARAGNLSAGEIEIIEVLLGEVVTQYNKEVQGKSGQIKPLEKYKRQFVPVMNQRGEKEVWVNCFCGSWDNWQQELVMVDGGGSCFFNVKINLSEKKTYDLIVNGSI
ncbi:MAG: hypothetical protein H7Y01_14295, partial [Ferruginibacter sp.]|nr:hypothetical protein [Chitinophagaceae bacterium]